MNHENVLRVADVIDGLPYGPLFFGDKKPDAFNMSATCGSACCIGGWTTEIFGARYVSLHDTAKILGLNYDQADALFKPPGYDFMECDGSAAAQVLRKMEAAGDDVTEFQIWDFWKQLWA